MNYSFYQVFCPDENNLLGVSMATNLTLRVIRCLNDDESVEILKEMQNNVMRLR